MADSGGFYKALVSSIYGSSAWVCAYVDARYCPLCAEYVESIVRSVTPEALESAKVKLVIIGNGSRRMLPAYSKLHLTPSNNSTDLL